MVHLLLAFCLSSGLNVVNGFYSQRSMRSLATRLFAKARQQQRFDGRVVLVTGGASSGLGQTIVRAFEDEGATVVVGDIVDDEGALISPTGPSDAEADRPSNLGPNAHMVRLDVRVKEDWDSAIAYCETLGGLDVLVNNAQVVEFGGLSEASPLSFHHVMDINQVGVFLGMKEAYKTLKSRKGNVVNLCSVAGLQGYGGEFAYVASDWAIRGMTKAAALDLAPDIRVNAIFFGALDESLAGHRIKVERQPIPRIGEPSEVASAVLFMASDEASFVTGAELAVDGGASLGLGKADTFEEVKRIPLVGATREW